MATLSTASPPANELQQSTATVASNGSANSQEYSDAQLVVVGAAMAVLVVAIVFGKFRHFGIILLFLGLILVTIFLTRVWFC